MNDSGIIRDVVESRRLSDVAAERSGGRTGMRKRESGNRGRSGSGSNSSSHRSNSNNQSNRSDMIELDSD